MTWFKVQIPQWVIFTMNFNNYIALNTDIVIALSIISAFNNKLVEGQ